MSRGTRARAPRAAVLFGTAAILFSAQTALASSPGVDVRLTNDDPSTSGYISADALAGISNYTDATLDECSRSRGRENEPSLAINPDIPAFIYAGTLSRTSFLRKFHSAAFSAKTRSFILIPLLVIIGHYR